MNYPKYYFQNHRLLLSNNGIILILVYICPIIINQIFKIALKPLKVIISGGGTGGHIYPAIAIANELKARNPQTEILFVGAKGRMEMEKVPKAGYPIKGLWISGIQRKISIDNLSFPFKVISSLLEAKKIIKEFKPDIAIGVGGYASGPLLYAASGMKIPCLVQEQNSHAGLTNKWLAKRVQKICVAYQGMEKFFPKDKIILTGNPVRSDILDIKNKRQEAFDLFQLDANQRTIFSVGGSLGARSINESIAANLDLIKNAGIQLLWQTGKPYFEEAKQKVKEAGLSAVIKVCDFIYQMDMAYSLADVVISRAGALAISELCIVGKPTIFVPYPLASEDHQTKNAMALVEKNAAMCIKDTEAKSTLISEAINLLDDLKKSETFSNNILQLAKPNASKEIIEEVLKLV